MIRAKVVGYSVVNQAHKVIHPAHGHIHVDLLIDHNFTDDPLSMIGKEFEWEHEYPAVLIAGNVREVKEPQQ